MNQLELNIAQQLGASAFLVYSVLKMESNLTSRELQIICNLSENCARTSALKLVDSGIISRTLSKNSKFYIYKTNDVFDWKI